MFSECLENLKYCCDLCQFKSNDKTKYSYHLNSKKHKLNVGNIDTITSTNEKQFNCDCGFKTSHQQSLSRHKKRVRHLQIVIV